MTAYAFTTNSPSIVVAQDTGGMYQGNQYQMTKVGYLAHLRAMVFGAGDGDYLGLAVLMMSRSTSVSNVSVLQDISKAAMLLGGQPCSQDTELLVGYFNSGNAQVDKYTMPSGGTVWNYAGTTSSGQSNSFPKNVSRVIGETSDEAFCEGAIRQQMNGGNIFGEVVLAVLTDEGEKCIIRNLK